MQAVVLTGHGGPDMLIVEATWPVPMPSRDQVLIRVGACGVNNKDINTRIGWCSMGVTSHTHAGERGFKNCVAKSYPGKLVLIADMLMAQSSPSQAHRLT